MYFETINHVNCASAHKANYYNHIAKLANYFRKDGEWTRDIDSFRGYDDRASAVRELAYRFLCNLETNPHTTSIQVTLEQIVSDIWSSINALENN